MIIRDRIKDFRRVRASDLRPNPRNWRTHPPAQQDALRGLLADVGYADALLTRELEDGTLMLIDGHLRAETTPDAVVPVLVLDVDEEEAGKILLTLDPLAGLATTDDTQLQLLLSEIETTNESVQAFMDDIARKYAAEPLPLGIADRPEIVVPQSYQVVVECHDEDDQQAIYERMRSEGYRCRVLTL
jgi:hypothetical protein